MNYYKAIRPLLFKLPPEFMHSSIVSILKMIDNICPSALNLFAKKYMVYDESLNQELLGNYFANPVGLAGGYDKNGNIIRPIASLGFGFLEFGTFTPLAQKGNKKPRLFRLVEQESLQNAMGFNNIGKKKIISNISKIYPFVLPLGANIGKNKTTSNNKAIKDYIDLLNSFKDLCDYFIINISSPNTNNLRDLQNIDFISNLMQEAKTITQKSILIKIAPDMNEKDALDLCYGALKAGVSGFIIANTSIDYTLINNSKTFGGISGKLITKKNATFFKILAKELYGKTILIASGGIDNANEAYDRIKDGANLIQIYTALIYKGPSLIYNINKGLIELLKKDGFANISEAVGINLK